MQTKYEYMIGYTSKNLIYIIRRVTDEQGRLLHYEHVENFKKYSTQKRFKDDDHIQAYIKSLNID